MFKNVKNKNIAKLVPWFWPIKVLNYKLNTHKMVNIKVLPAKPGEIAYNKQLNNNNNNGEKTLMINLISINGTSMQRVQKF